MILLVQYTTVMSTQKTDPENPTNYLTGTLNEKRQITLTCTVV